jgi:hypothetical protein
MVEILKSTLGDDIPSYGLALVCKRWKNLLSETSTFWRKMRASFVPAEKIYVYASRLRRRLELSQGALIDVTLDASGLRIDSSKTLFEILGSVDVRRWRSLRLEGTGRPLPSDTISGYFTGTFTSLRSLYLETTSGEDPYWPIYDMIARSPPTITMINTDKPVPMVLRTSATLSKIVDIVIPAQMYGEIHEKTAVETVRLTHSYSMNPTLLPRLPKHVTIDITSGDVLSALDLRAVQTLDLRYYRTEDDHTINLPSLVSLVLPKNIRYIRGFVAPALQSLVVGNDNLWGKEKLKESRKIVTLFQDDPDQISMAPTSLDMCLSITITAAIVVLSHWTQLQHVRLDLTFGDGFSWDGGFIKALKNSMCPNMITLKLRTDWEEAESERWRQRAVELFKRRSTVFLELISWTSAASHEETPFILTRKDL